MGKFIVGALIGLVLGGVLTFYFFVGVPSAEQAPGAPIQAPDAGGLPPGTAQIVLRQDFFNAVLDTIFAQMQPPAFPLGPQQPGQACDSTITILREGSGVRTSLRLENDTISAPLAFSGSYNSPFGCFQFTGWAQANFQMRFDAQNQAVFGQINVETVNLDGVNPIVGALLTPIVQSTLNTRVNPIKIIDGRQIAVNLPVTASNGNLQAAVADVRAEVTDNALNLYAIYDFSGVPRSLQPSAAP